MNNTITAQDGTLIFGGIPESRSRTRTFAISYGIQAAIVAALMTVTVAAPQIVTHRFERVELVPPAVTPAPKVATRRPPPISQPSVKQLREIAPKEPLIARVPVTPAQPQALPRQRVAEVVPAPVLAPAPAPKIDVIAKAPHMPEKIVATNVFGGSSATPTLSKPAKQVQTGGFGDPNGVKPSANGSERANIAAVGSFDLPAGGGQGNGSGGTHGVRGTIASSGFGSGMATQESTGRTGRVQSTSFASTATATPEARKAPSAAQAPSTPVSIQMKPRPVYTAEARQMKIEGEVLLQVLFTADGKIQVLKVVRGLGHGLDEAAARAAEGIKFSPAQRDGHPVDSSATLHIVFQLS